MKRVLILSAWSGDGLSRLTRFRPAIEDHYPLISVPVGAGGDGGSITDFTGQLSSQLSPTPNVHLVQVVCADTTLDAIEADPRYDGAVVWSEDV